MSYLEKKSTYFEGENLLNEPDEAIVRVFVENEDDIPFWKDIFDKFNLRTKIHPASEISLARGKKEVLKQKNRVGKFLILCVDSDYDYLLQGHTDNSKTINESPYIFQTYTYSIENYKCYAESLHRVMVRATLQDKQELFDYVRFLKEYSVIIYDLFIYSLHYTKEKSDGFTIEDFSKTIKLLEQVDYSSQGQEALAKLKKAVKEKLAILDKIPDEQIKQFKAELHKLGVEPENTYLFMKGHTLYDNVVCMFLRPIFQFLRSAQSKRISELKQCETEAKEMEKQYRKLVTKDIELVLLRNNTDYYDCFLMKKILSDIEKYNQHCSI